VTSKRLLEQLQKKAALRTTREDPEVQVLAVGQNPAPAKQTIGQMKTASAATGRMAHDWEAGLAAKLQEKTKEAAELSALVEELRSQGVDWKILPLDPALVDVIGFNRFASTFDARQDSQFRDLLENIIAIEGNKQPGMVVPSPTDPGRFHLVFGERRLRACQQAGLPFSAIVADLGADDLWLYREIENFGRADKGILETAIGLIDMPEKFAYGERSTILAKLKISQTHYRRLKTIAAVPVAVWEVIPSAHLATQSDAVRVADAYKADAKGVVTRSKKVKSSMGRTEAIDTLCGTTKTPPATNWSRLLRKGSKIQVTVVSVSEESAQELEREIRELLDRRGLAEPDGEAE